MPNNRKIKKNRGNKDYSLFAMLLRADEGIIRARILKKSRRKRSLFAGINNLIKTLAFPTEQQGKRIIHSSTCPQGRYIGGADPVNENE